MNVAVVVYLDKNLGDDIMLSMLLDKLNSKGHRCYLVANNEFTYNHIKKMYKEIEVIPSIDRDILVEKHIKHVIRIGGSLYQHNTHVEGIMRYKNLIEILKLKKYGIKYSVLGCNVGPFTVKTGVNATKKILKMADVVTCRDRFTHQFISGFRNENIHIYPDIVLGMETSIDNKKDRDILGVVPYTSYIKDSIKENQKYCKNMIDTINLYIDKTDNDVYLFSFDTGFKSDLPSINEIFSQIDKKEKIKIIPYTGDIDSFLNEYKKCSVIIGARFHAMILAMKYKIPVLPIIYSNKAINMLEDLSYKGKFINFKDSKKIEVEDITNEIIKKENLLLIDDQSIFKDATKHIDTIINHLDNL